MQNYSLSAPAHLRRGVLLVGVATVLWSARFSAAQDDFSIAAPGKKPDDFRIVVQRERVIPASQLKSGTDDLIEGVISVNGQLLGGTYENARLKIEAGHYSGGIRRASEKGHAQGAFGAMGNQGDFLVEIVGVPGRSALLFHAGNLPRHTEGCIALGQSPRREQVANRPERIPYDKTTLVKLRRLYYGSDVSNSSVQRRIFVTIIDPPSNMSKRRHTLLREASQRFQEGKARFSGGHSAEANVSFRQAERLYRLVIGLDPNDVEAHSLVAGTLAAQRRWREAEAAYRDVIRLVPSDGKPHADLAAVLLASGQRSRARAEAEDAKRLGCINHFVFSAL